MEGMNLAWCKDVATIPKSAHAVSWVSALCTATLLSKSQLRCPIPAYLAPGLMDGFMVVLPIWYWLQEMGALHRDPHIPTHCAGYSHGHIFPANVHIEAIKALNFPSLGEGWQHPAICKQPAIPHITWGAYTVYVRMLCRRMQSPGGTVGRFSTLLLPMHIVLPISSLVILMPRTRDPCSEVIALFFPSSFWVRAMLWRQERLSIPAYKG